MSRSVERRLATQYPELDPETVKAIADQQQQITAREAMGDTQRLAVECSSAVGNAIGLMTGASWREELPQHLRASLTDGAEKLRAAYDRLMAAMRKDDAKLLAIERLCEEGGKMVSAEVVREILDR